MSEREIVTCGLCGEPMPPGEEMFNYHGYSGPCPKPPALAAEDESDEGAARPEGSGDSWAPPLRRPVPLATPQTETLLDVPHAEVDALVEAIYAERRALSPPPDVERLTREQIRERGRTEMTRIEAIRQRAERRTSPYGDIEAQEDMDALLTLWDTRETALRAIVQQMEQLQHGDPSDSYEAGRMAAQSDLIEKLSRLLEQEP